MPVWNASRSVKARIVRSLFNDIPPVSPDIRCLDLPKEDPRSQQAHRKSLGIPRNVRNVRNVNGHIGHIASLSLHLVSGFFFLDDFQATHVTWAVGYPLPTDPGSAIPSTNETKSKSWPVNRWAVNHSVFFLCHVQYSTNKKKMNPAWTKAVHSNFIHCTWTKQTLHPNSPTIELTSLIFVPKRFQSKTQCLASIISTASP